MTPRWIAGHGYVDSQLSEAWKLMGYRCRRSGPNIGMAVFRPDGSLVASGRSAPDAWRVAALLEVREGFVTVFSSLDSDNLNGVYEVALDELERDPSIGWERALERAKGNL